MATKNGSELDAARRIRRVVGAVAVFLLLVFTVLALLLIITLIEWLIADVAVAIVANFVLRRVGRKTTQ